MQTAATDWTAAISALGPAFAARAADHDEHDRFVFDNYADLKGQRVFSAMIPTELGGGGCSHSEMCAVIRELATFCSSTALALSMHQHLVAAAVWNYRRGRPGEQLLRRVVDGERVLISTGATDWLNSSGHLEPCEGGFRFSAKKVFASGSPAGDLLITSGQYHDPDQGWQVLHFPVPFAAEGVRIEEVWRAMGMRGTGSHNVVLEDVFVPAESVVLRRPRGQYHPVWNVILTVAMPLICAAYVGIAEATARLVREQAAQRGDDGLSSLLFGEMENELTAAQVAFDSMVAIANDLEVEPDMETTNRILIRKTLVTQAVIRTTEKALETTGGGGYFRPMGLERLVRDAHAGQFHPLQPKKQQRFTGRLSMGLDPVQRVPTSTHRPFLEESLRHPIDQR